MPSRTETLGLVVLEAMCAGLPVVAARAGGIPEMIEDGVDGCLVDDDSEAIDRIGELLRSDGKKESMGTQARAHAAGRSWRSATEQLVGYYEKAIEMQTFDQAPETHGQAMTMGARTRKAIGRATVFALRKLLP